MKYPTIILNTLDGTPSDLGILKAIDPSLRNLIVLRGEAENKIIEGGRIRFQQKIQTSSISELVFFALKNIRGWVLNLYTELKVPRLDILKEYAYRTTLYNEHSFLLPATEGGFDLSGQLLCLHDSSSLYWRPDLELHENIYAQSYLSRKKIIGIHGLYPGDRKKTRKNEEGNDGFNQNERSYLSRIHDAR